MECLQTCLVFRLQLLECPLLVCVDSIAWHKREVRGLWVKGHTLLVYTMQQRVTCLK